MGIDFENMLAGVVETDLVQIDVKHIQAVVPHKLVVTMLLVAVVEEA